MSGGEEGETRLHWLRPQHQLVALAGFAWEENHSPPSFSPATTKREAGSEKTWRPGCQPLLLGAVLGAGKEIGQELPSMGVFESVFGILGG